MQHLKKPKRNQKQSQVKTAQTKSSFNTKYAFVNISTPNVDREVKQIDRVREDYIPFGKDNLFPQYLADLKRHSSTHRSVLAQKTTFTTGSGFKTENNKLKEFISDFLDVANNDLKDKYEDKGWDWGNLPHFEKMLEVIREGEDNGKTKNV